MERKINTGKDFEKYTASLFKMLLNNTQYDSIEQNVRLETPDGNREIDILIKSTIAGIQTTTIIECKNQNRKITIKEVDAAHSKLNDVRANLGIIVSSIGFTKGASSKAKRVGIILWIYKQTLSHDFHFRIEVPILVIESFLRESRVLISIKKEDIHRSHTKPNILDVNDFKLSELLKEVWERGTSSFDDSRPGIKTIFVTFPQIQFPYFVRDLDNNKIFLDDYCMEVKIDISYYFSFLNDKSDIKLAKISSQGKETIVIDALEFFNYYRKNFKKINSRNELPLIDNMITLRMPLTVTLAEKYGEIEYYSEPSEIPKMKGSNP